MVSQMKFSDYIQLPRHEQEALKTSVKRSGFKLSSIISMEFDWLIEGDFEDHRWVIKIGNKKETINWDSTFPAPKRRDNKNTVLLGKGRKLSDNPLIIEDMKTAFVIVKMTKSNIKLSLGNASGCRSFAYSLKRYVTDVMMAPHMLNPSMLKRTAFDRVMEEASNKRSITLGYVDIIERYFEQTKLDDIPIQYTPANKCPPQMDVGFFREELGVDPDVYKSDDNVKAIIGRKELEMVGALAIRGFKPRYTAALEKTKFSTKTNRATYEDFLSAVEGAHKAFRLLPHLFNYDFAPFTFDRNFLLENQDFDEKLDLAGRTRDIPPLTFLQMMDAAARFVLDYADELLEAEKYLRQKQEGYIKQGLSSEAVTDRTNIDARNWRCSDDRKHSPFPLGSYKHTQKGNEASKKYPQDVIELIRLSILNGEESATTRERFKLTRAQYNSLKRRLVLHPSNGGMSLQKAIYQYLIFSCTVIIFALTARRESEVYSLKAGCVSNDASDKLWINCYVAKTLQDEYNFSTVSLVEKAVKILEKLSASARKKLGTDSLFVFEDTYQRDAPRNLNRINEVAERFFDFIGAERDENGQHWKLSEHQFRRFFAVMYFYHYEDAKADALMHEFKHVDWGMTEVYLTLKAAGAMKKKQVEASRSVMNDRIYDYLVRENVGGKMLPRLKAEVAESIKSVADVRNKRDRAIRKIAEHSYVIDFISTGICFGATPSLSDSGSCNCHDEALGKALIHKASNDMCAGCPAQLTVPEIGKGHIKLLEDNGQSDILMEVCNGCER
ncbi:hypothetical protein A6E08_18560 [Vibrio lentus]|nr:hypothetical protein A6E08_18560 [Vibrio lentus]PMI59988.1 hypothetical protein BCU41_02680 [Vibrio lentus]